MDNPEKLATEGTQAEEVHMKEKIVPSVSFATVRLINHY
jgi:hypothetical protein